jgi:hypothetical protein
MLSDVSVSRQLGLVLRDLLLRTTGLPACSLLHQSDLTSWEVNLPTSRSLRNPPSALVVLNVTNKQGGIANELMDDGNETIDITANIAAIYIGH